MVSNSINRDALWFYWRVKVLTDVHFVWSAVAFLINKYIFNAFTTLWNCEKLDSILIITFLHYYIQLKLFSFAWMFHIFIFTFVILSLGRYLCWWTISPQGYRPPSSLCIIIIIIIIIQNLLLCIITFITYDYTKIHTILMIDSESMCILCLIHGTRTLTKQICCQETSQCLLNYLIIVLYFSLN